MLQRFGVSTRRGEVRVDRLGTRAGPDGQRLRRHGQCQAGQASRREDGGRKTPLYDVQHEASLCAGLLTGSVRPQAGGFRSEPTWRANLTPVLPSVIPDGTISLREIVASSPIPIPVPGRSPETDPPGIDAVTLARWWDNPCWFAFRFNYLSLRYNIPLYEWVQREYGLLRPHVAVIYSLGLRDRVTARAIGISFGYPKNTLSRAIHSLERKGLIRRERKAADKRSFLLTLTKRGRAVFDETLPNFLRVQEELLKPLAPGERETLSALLAKIVLHNFA